MKSNSHKRQILVFFMVATTVIIALPVSNVIKKGWTNDVEKLFLADDVESIWNVLSYQLLNQSNEPKKVISGKNGFMFLGNGYGRILHKMRNIYPYSQKMIENWVMQLAQLEQFYQDNAVKFGLFMVPNKHSIYSEHLPDWVSLKRPYISDHLSYAAKQNAISFLDLRPVFTAAKSAGSLLYWKKDSHWNYSGAAVGFMAILDYMNNQYGLELRKPSIRYTEKMQAGLGLARLLKIDHLIELGPAGLQFDMPLASGFCRGQIDPKTMKLLTCEPVHNGYLNIHKGSQYFINEQALNQQKVLLLCDSFAMQSIRLYQESFETVWAFHYNKVSDEHLQQFIAANKPDLVIYQIVERAAFTPDFLNIK